MKSTDHRDSSFLSRLSPFSRRRLESLLQSEFAEQIEREGQHEALQERIRLVGELRDLEAGVAQPKKALETAMQRQVAKTAQAQRALAVELDAEKALRRQDYGSEIGHLNRRKEIVGKLEASADPRLKDFIFYLGELLSVDTKVALQFGFETGDPWWGGRPRLTSNGAEVSAARSALQDAIDQANALRHSAVSFTEVTRRFEAICQLLSVPLARLDLNPPSLTIDDQVAPPMRWNGALVWRRDAGEPVETGPEARAQRSEELSAKVASNEA